MTEYEIARRLEVSPQAVSKWYHGKSLPTQVNLLKLSKVVGRTPEALLRLFLTRRLRGGKPKRRA
jgi:transcriptional regulator with XRE-family HTH domain